jgi:hypothetical protein
MNHCKAEELQTFAQRAVELVRLNIAAFLLLNELKKHLLTVAELEAESGKSDLR